MLYISFFLHKGFLFYINIFIEERRKERREKREEREEITTITYLQLTKHELGLQMISLGFVAIEMYLQILLIYLHHPIYNQVES